MIDFKDIAISVPAAQENGTVFFDALRSDFSRIEIEGESLSSSWLPGILRKKSLEVVSIINLIHTSLLANLYSQDEKISRELIEVINSGLGKEYVFGIKNFIFDSGLDLSNNEKIKKALWFFRAITNTTLRKKRTICIPITLPNSNIRETSENLKSLICGMMLSNFKVCLNIYIHEVKSNIQPQEIYSMFKFDLGIIRLIYEPATGNYITETLLEHWLEPLRKIKYAGDIVLCPKVNDLPHFENEIKRLVALLTQR